MQKDKQERYLELLAGLRLMDDDFFSEALDEKIAPVEYILNTVLERDDIRVLRTEAQVEYKSAANRSIKLDIRAVDAEGRVMDIEVQRADRGAGVRRARFHSSMLDRTLLDKGKDFEDLVDTYVIFITEHDRFGAGLPLYHVERRIAELDEQSFRRELWQHRPLTDFWRVGRGYASKLEARGIYTMGDIARCSVYNEELLYRLFGKNAELLIDHAWGWEPCTIADVKGYRPQVCSLSSGQVLHRAYESAEALLVLREMADALALELVSKALVTDQIVLTVGYDIDNLKAGSSYRGAVKIDRYGRRVPQHAHGSFNLGSFSSSSKLLVQAAADLYERITDSNLLVRRLTLAANHVLPAQAAAKKQERELSLFDFGNEAVQQAAGQRENRLQQAQLEIKRRFGKNAVLKGMSLLDGATAKERNEQIGGHKA